jgi:hypothetical protein
LPDAYDFDVASVISGYGASDLLTEAMGGWFFYGYTDLAIWDALLNVT